MMRRLRAAGTAGAGVGEPALQAEAHSRPLHTAVALSRGGQRRIPRSINGLMLHVLNGDSTRYTLERSGVPGDITVWADVLHNGPVPDVPAARLRATRAAHLASSFGETQEHVDREMARQDALDDYRAHEEVVFWFEHDLFDQLLLLRHLHWLSEVAPGTTRFSLICRDEYLGPLAPERLRELFPTREAITRDQIEAGREGWHLFRQPDPRGLAAWVERGGAAPLEFMADALHRLFEEFPSSRDGLSRTERQALEAVRDGAARLKDTFVQSQQMEERIFMGDWSFWEVARRLASGPHLLLSVDPPLSGRASGNEKVSLTADGRRVLAGTADHVALNGIDRWLGGVHLTPESCWRWTGTSFVA